MTVVSTTTEIASSPEHVRRVLLDFAQMPEWTKGFIRSIKPAVEKEMIENGDKLHVTLEGASFSPIVLENSPQEFKWRGSIPGLLYGDHSFRFEPGSTPHTTTFTHSEEFSGLLAFLMKLIPQGSKQQEGFEGFNNDLKKRVESEAREFHHG